MRKALMAAALVAVLTAAACASDGSSSGSGGGLYGGGSSSAGPTGSSASPSAGGGGRYGYGSDGGSGSGGGGGGGGGGGPVAGSVVVANFSFTPSTVQVKSGATIALQNTNPQTPHTFTVTGQDIDASLDPMSTTDVTIDLPPGTYPFICRFHSSSGMKGTLVVQ